MKKYIFGIFVLCFSLSFSISYAEKPLDSLETKKLIDSIDVLNNRLKADYYMFKEGGFKERLEAESKLWEGKHSEQIGEIRRQNNVVSVLLALIGALGIGSAITVFIAYKTNMKKIVAETEKESREKMDNMVKEIDIKYANRIKELDEKIIKDIADLVRSSPENLRKVINTREEEQKLVTQAKILVLSQTESATSSLTVLFRRYGFDSDRIVYKTIEKYSIEEDKKEINDKKHDFDVLFFNNDDGGISENNLKNLPNYTLNSSQRMYFFFGSGRLEGIDKRLFLSANFTSTLYDNLVALLRYKKLMID
jgi:hypothetical protein